MSKKHTPKRMKDILNENSHCMREENIFYGLYGLNTCNKRKSPQGPINFQFLSRITHMDSIHVLANKRLSVVEKCAPWRVDQKGNCRIYPASVIMHMSYDTVWRKINNGLWIYDKEKVNRPVVPDRLIVPRDAQVSWEEALAQSIQLQPADKK